MTTRQKLQEFAKQYRLRKDWHEPDEEGVTAKVIGQKFDNAHGDDEWGMEAMPRFGIKGCKQFEKVIVLSVNRKKVLVVNLATVLALATNPDLDQ